MSKREKLFIFFVLLVALCLRLLWIFHLDNNVDVWGDWWDEIASNLISGKGYMIDNPFNPGDTPYYSWRPPAFPIFLAGIYATFGHNFLYAKIGLALLSTLSVLIGYLVAKKLFNPFTGILTTIGMAIYPTFIFFTGYLAPETLTLFLILLTIFYLTGCIDHSNSIYTLLAGLSLGCAVMCRTTMALFFCFILIWFFLVVKNKQEIWKKFFIIVAGMLIVILPWVVRNYRIHRTIVFHSTDAGQALFINNNPESFRIEPSGTAFIYDSSEFLHISEVETTKIFKRRAKDFIINHPATYIKYVGKRFLNFWRPIPYRISGPGKAYSYLHQIISGIYTVPVFIFAILGLLYSIKNWRKLFILYALIIYYSGTYILVRAIIRYRMPIEPYLIMFAAYGISVLWQNNISKIRT
ncbi:MAG: glycosyltransferase family 39 protein [Candidatus Ratteibacteria bacterium]|nr:glycosyltransferase family 39 protein [Candidatus Ratteibacteria bacterium]